MKFGIKCVATTPTAFFGSTPIKTNRGWEVWCTNNGTIVLFNDINLAFQSKQVKWPDYGIHKYYVEEMEST